MTVYLITSEQRAALARVVDPASLATCIHEAGGSYVVDEIWIDWLRQVSQTVEGFPGDISNMPRAEIASRMREPEMPVLLQSSSVRLAAVTIVALFAAGMIAALAVVLA